MFKSPFLNQSPYFYRRSTNTWQTFMMITLHVVNWSIGIYFCPHLQKLMGFFHLARFKIFLGCTALVGKLISSRERRNQLQRMLYFTQAHLINLCDDDAKVCALVICFNSSGKKNKKKTRLPGFCVILLDNGVRLTTGSHLKKDKFYYGARRLHKDSAVVLQFGKVEGTVSIFRWYRGSLERLGFSESSAVMGGEVSLHLMYGLFHQ